jgi:DNA (cytosine-5)-methyltransferase 1
MGLPEGWVCDVPRMTRNQKLKVLGNGVVPQQAVAALNHLWPLLLESQAS